MKIFEPQNDELILAHVTLFGAPFREGKRSVESWCSGTILISDKVNSIDGSVETVPGGSHRLFVRYWQMTQSNASPVKTGINANKLPSLHRNCVRGVSVFRCGCARQPKVIPGGINDQPGW